MMTWNELGEKIASMTPEQRRRPVQSIADRFALAAVHFDIGDEVPKDLVTATGVRYRLDEVEDLDEGRLLAWYHHQEPR